MPTSIIKKYTIGDGEHVIIDCKKSLGSHIVDIYGKKYLDCNSQYGSQALGWNHPKLVEKSQELGEIARHKVANPDFHTKELATFVSTFANVAPDFKHFFFIEGGSLAVENAIKVAFDWKAQKLGLNEEECNKMDIIHLKEAFHGRSGYTLSLTNTVHNKVAKFPKFPWTRVLNPKIGSIDIEEAEIESVNQIKDALKGRHKVAAIILETIQGEGGDNHFRPEYFAYLRKIADENEVLLILDEVQTGFGITGKMWAYEHYGIIPDLICFGKKTQVCGIASTGRIDDISTNVFNVSSRINSTWGGNIVDMVRCTHIINVIKKDNLLDNANVVGDYFLSELKKIENVDNVRGKGLFLAFDVKNEIKRDEVMFQLKKNMTILQSGSKSVRIRTHLTFSKENVDEAIGYISKAV